MSLYKQERKEAFSGSLLALLETQSLLIVSVGLATVDACLKLAMRILKSCLKLFVEDCHTAVKELLTELLISALLKMWLIDGHIDAWLATFFRCHLSQDLQLI